MKGSHGYTLFEVLVAFAVMGLVMASIPAIVASARPGPELRATAEELAATLRLARSEAVAEYRPIAVEIDVRQKTYGLAGGKVRRLGDEDAEIVFVTARSELSGNEAGRIRFFPDGSSTGGRVTLSAEGRSYIVTVSWLTGAVEVEG